MKSIMIFKHVWSGLSFSGYCLRSKTQILTFTKQLFVIEIDCKSILSYFHFSALLNTIAKKYVRKTVTSTGCPIFFYHPRSLRPLDDILTRTVAILLKWQYFNCLI